MPAETVLLAKTTPEIEDENPTPVNKEPAIPAPPETTNPPVPSEVAAVLYSTANLVLLNCAELVLSVCWNDIVLPERGLIVAAKTADVNEPPVADI